jgi:uncharacterized protein YndB with AHSA1/START domain
MPTITRTRTVQAAPAEVWRVLSDPHQLPRWWPAAKRVEDVTDDAFTIVLGSSRGRSVRADYSLLAIEPLERLSWRQEVEESPFERILAESVTEFALDGLPGGETRVELTIRNRPRGFARFGVIQLRRATTRQADQALDGLEHLFGPVEEA